MKNLLLFVFLSIAVFPTKKLSGQAPLPIHVASEEHLAIAVETVARGNDLDALGQFDAALSTARRSQDLEWSNDFQLRVASIIQRIGPEGKMQEVAMRTYERVLADRPDSPVIWNNLAKLYAGSGRSAEADSLFRMAVAAGGRYELVFQLNYAEFVLDQGLAARAAGLYEQIVAEYPDDRRANDGLAKAYVAQADVSGLTAYCWREISLGHARRIVGIAMDVLPSLAWDDAPDDASGATSEGPPWGWSNEYASIIAAALARARYDPLTFLESDVGRRLRELARESEALDGLVRLFGPARPADLQARSFDWWAAQEYEPFEEAPRKSPRDSFRLLARQIGSEYRISGDRKTADAYYTLAAGLSRDEVDPEAVLEMAEMRFEVDDVDGLDSVLAVYNHLLFEGKGAAYLRGDNATIYRYQRALGIMYGRLGRWGKDDQIGTANFHLREAIRAAEANNESESGERIMVSPEIINLRAKSLLENGNASSGLDLQLKYAQKYTDAGKPGAARSIYSGVRKLEQEVNVSSDQEARIRVLEADVQTTKKYRTPQK